MLYDLGTYRQVNRGAPTPGGCTALLAVCAPYHDHVLDSPRSLHTAQLNFFLLLRESSEKSCRHAFDPCIRILDSLNKLGFSACKQLSQLMYLHYKQKLDGN